MDQVERSSREDGDDDAPLSDADLVEYASSFRSGLLGRRSSEGMCAAVCYPLAGLLRVDGVPCEAMESDISEALGLLHANHVWIRLEDGRALDPTADQFNRWGRELPAVYLGPPLDIHCEPSPLDLRNYLPRRVQP